MESLAAWLITCRFSTGWVWLIGLAGMVLYAAISWLRLKGRLRTAVRLRDNIWQSDRIAAPFVLGVLRPRIYLPFSLPQAALPQVRTSSPAPIWAKSFSQLPGMKGLSSTPQIRAVSSRL